jgi:hypothetical protein
LKKIVFALFLPLGLYIALMIPLSSHMAQRPIAVRLGFMPRAEVLKLTLGDQQPLVAQLSMVKLFLYFGSLVDRWRENVIAVPEYFNMFKTVETAVKLDPYNMDAYYFAQSAFTWEVGHAEDVNDLLEYGMKYRTWDWYLPYFAGFNAAYFLQEYDTAAKYMEKASELSDSPLFTKLAARYFFEAGRSQLGAQFLQSMIDSEQDPKVKKAYQLRLMALEASYEIEKALEEFKKKFGERPDDLSALEGEGFLPSIPEDPYGGNFYLDDAGKVRSTSRFANPNSTKDIQ